ncbi:serine protease [Euzebya sp.]|uniref:serine protease n=1 Tax=Euzebya sp. TaxID=1971409 RepID=UPI003512D344
MSPTLRRPVPLVALLVLCLAAALALTAPPADAQPAWAPADSATIHPGTQTYTEGAQCTANFVFTGGGEVYIGQAAHCSGTGGQTETDGCLAGSLPLGTPVEIDGASRPGTLAYNSWLAMQQAGETDPDACAYNDFALVRVHPDDHDLVNPSLPVIGGPVGLNTDGTAAGELMHSFGNSSLRLGIETLSPKLAVSLGTSGGGWTHTHYAVSPGIPGDSGSGFLDDEGNAVGVLSTLAIAPLPASNNASDLSRSVSYMEAHGGPQVDLALGTEPFTPLIVGGGLPALPGLG